MNSGLKSTALRRSSMAQYEAGLVLGRRHDKYSSSQLPARTLGLPLLQLAATSKGCTVRTCSHGFARIRTYSHVGSTIHPKYDATWYAQLLNTKFMSHVLQVWHFSETRSSAVARVRRRTAINSHIPPPRYEELLHRRVLPQS